MYERTPDLSTNVVYTSLRQIRPLGIMLDEGRLVDAERTVAYIGGDWATNEEIQNVPADLETVKAETLTIHETAN